MYPASSAGKRFTSTKEVNIFLEQVSITKNSWLDHAISLLFSCYLVIQGCLNSSDPPPPQNSLWCGKKEEKQPFSSERRGEAVLNWGPFAYQSNALPLGHTGSPVIILWEDPIYIPPPPRPPLECTFLGLIKYTFLSASWSLFFQ